MVFIFLILLQNSTSDERPVTHWIPWLTVHSLAEDWQFDRQGIPHDMWNTLRLEMQPLQHLIQI